jgi:hypothetical protein
VKALRLRVFYSTAASDEVESPFKFANN